MLPQFPLNSHPDENGSHLGAVGLRRDAPPSQGIALCYQIAFTRL